MTSKSELDEILDACDACAGEDSVSYYDHFQTCPKCLEYAAEAEKFEESMDVLLKMASHPYEIARMSFWTMIKPILGMPLAEGRGEMGRIMDAIPELPEEAMNTLVKVRTDLLWEMPQEHRERFQGIMKEIHVSSVKE